MLELSIVIPCYNEEKNLPFLFAKLEHLETANGAVEFVLVDNGSTDNSAQVLANLIEKSSLTIQLVKVEKNIGYGFGILSGLKAAHGKCLAWTHADLQTDVKDVLIAYRKFIDLGRPDDLVVKGRRKGRPIIDALFTFGMTLMVNLVLRARLSDINAQPKLFAREFFEKYIRGNAPHDFSLDLYLLFQAYLHGRIATIPVDFSTRMHGEAKGGGSLTLKWKLTKRTLSYVIRLRRTFGFLKNAA